VLPTPTTDRIAEWVGAHLGHLTAEPDVVPSPRFPGTQEAADRALATTFTPVPKARRLRSHLDVAELHPWPWLVRPSAGSIRSFSAWRRDR